MTIEKLLMIIENYFNLNNSYYKVINILIDEYRMKTFISSLPMSGYTQARILGHYKNR
jgi:hypothetical protein